MPRRAIAVIGPGAPDEGAAADAARAVGLLLAQAGATVVTGGLGGVMAAAGGGARAAGGSVTAILPGTITRVVAAKRDVQVRVEEHVAPVHPDVVGRERHAARAPRGPPEVLVGRPKPDVVEALVTAVFRGRVRQSSQQILE